MKKPRLDDIDLKILRILQTDGRVTNVELARQAGISAPPCLRRVRALEKAGFITGYFAELDAQMLGLGVTVFAMVGLESQAENDLQAFEKRVAYWPEVLECHMLNGEIDFILKCIAPDLESFQEFLTKKTDTGAQCRQCAHLTDHSSLEGPHGTSHRRRVDWGSYLNFTPNISYDLPPPGVLTSTLSPTLLPISARAIGEEMEILRCSRSASKSPTI